MLDFMREQIAGALEQPQDTAGEAKSNKQPGCLLPQASKKEEYITVLGRKEKVRKTTYMFGALFFIGLLCLLFMIKKSSPTASAAATELTEGSKAAMVISQLLGGNTEMYSTMDRIVKKFYEFAEFEQIDVDELSKNPFRNDSVIRKIETGEAPVQPVVSKSEFELLTIMGTEKGNCCMINDKLLYKGDSIKGMRVEAITDQSVVLSNQEHRIVLKLAEPY